MINALVGQDLLRRGAGILTAMITRVQPGPEAQAVLRFKGWNEINGEIQQLDSNFRQEKIDGDEYVQKRQSLKHIKDSLKEECSRMGVIPP